jgi:hypothetical protein
LTRCGTARCLCPHPWLHYYHCGASGSISGTKPSKTTRRLSITREGEGAGAMMSCPSSMTTTKLRHLFNFHLMF